MNFYMLNRLVLTMKLTIILLLTIVIEASATGYAQKISIRVRSASLETVFQTFSRQSGYDFIYNTFDLKGTKPVSLNLRDAELATGMELCLKDQTLTYVIKDKTVIIRQKEKSLFFKMIDLVVPSTPIKGTVLDEKGYPLIGALVKNKQGKVLASTNVNGNFFLNVPEGTYLEISYLGYKAQELVTNKTTTTITVNLAQEVSKLDEIQIEAYDAKSKRKSTSSIATIGSEELMKQPVNNPILAMEGRLPGVVINQSTGVPGARANVQIRGRANFDRFLTSDQPLFIIDGVPMAAGNNKVSQLSGPFGAGLSDGLSAFSGINTADIESISVLKDADATSIYGSRGANGVIIITTKTGKAGKLKMDANIYSGVSTVTRMAKMLNTEQYIAMRKEALANDKITPSNGNAYDFLLWDNNRYTDFVKLLTGNNAQTNDAQVSFSGGSLSTQFRAGGGYHRETTVWPGNMSSDRGSVSFSINTTSEDQRFKLLFTGNYSLSNSNLTAIDLANAVTLPPNFKLYNDDDKLAWNEGNINVSKDNPLAVLNQKYLAKMSNLNANALLSYRLVDNLTIKSSMGYNTTQNDERRITPLSAQNPMKSNLSGFASFGNNQLKNWIIEPQAEYFKAIGRSRLNVLLGATYNQLTTAGLVVNANGYTSDELMGSLKSAPTTGITASNTATIYKYQAFFGRLNYNFAEKYIVNLTGRRDGSSRFGPNYRFSTFGAVGTAWIFTNESFFKNIKKVLSFGKLRASYGSTGNDQIGEYAYLDSWSSAGNYTDSATLYPTKLFNPNLHWERNNKMELALDLGFVKDRILVTAAYYRSISSDPLVNYPLPKTTGFSTIVQNLTGVEVLNHGLELTISSNNLSKGPLRWSTDFNLTIARNKLLKFPDLEKSSYSTSYAIGESLNRVFVSQYLGVDPNTGLYTVKDVNGDNLINTKDYASIGNTDPKFYGGLNNTFSYKRFSLSIFFQFSKQLGRSWVTNGLFNPPGSPFNVPDLVLNRWQKPGDITDIQKFTTSAGPISGASGFYALSFSNGAYVDVSYLRLKNVSFSYDLPVRWLGALHIRSCRIYAQGQNLFVISGYKLGDPEIQNYTRMSPLRTITGGLQLTL